MIYKTEFVISKDISKAEDYSRYVEYQKRNFALDIGRMIGEKEGFEKIDGEEGAEYEERWQEKYELKIVAFKYEKWMNFKKQMRLLVTIGGMPNVSEIFAELEGTN